MTKRFFRLLHLWLGLLSGLIVIIVCLTGSLYAFKDELTAAREPWRDVTDTGAALLRPSTLCAVANRAAGDSLPSSVTLGGRTEAAQVDYFSARGATTVFVNPYTGDVLKVVRRKPGDFDFFDFILQGHRRLWLPRHIGSPLVSYAVLAFFITLLTGLVVSWPRKWTRRAVKSHFAFHRPLRAARFRFDLHNVLGFYAVIPLIALCFTGLMFGLSWFSGGVYRLVSGGEPMASYRLPLAEDTGRDFASLDALHARLSSEAPRAVQFYYALPRTGTDVYRASIVHEKGSYYKQDNRFFDPYDLQELQGAGPWAGKYTEAMDIMSQYWGAMLDLGATTFWEDFDIDWTKNAARIDELVPKGKVDVHKTYGDYCYKGYRHSFCHGWASGPTTWLSRHVLGVKVLEPGCKKVAIEPHLGNLKWAKGTFPTPYGVIEISHEVNEKGKVISKVKAPKGVKIVKNK